MLIAVLKPSKAQIKNHYFRIVPKADIGTSDGRLAAFNGKQTLCRWIVGKSLEITVTSFLLLDFFERCLKNILLKGLNI
jgi:hypothetical protein